MSQKLHTLIVDDEPAALAILKRMLADHPDIELVAEATNLDEAFAACATQRIDLIFLDIGLGSDSRAEGFALASFAGTMPATPSIIFVTGEPNHALEAHEHHPASFLLKPVGRDVLAVALQRVRQEHAARDRGQEPTLAIRFSETNAYNKSIRSVAYLRPRDIVLFHTNQYKDDGRRDGTLTVVLKEETLTGVRERLDYLEGRLGAYRFFRIHAGCLVNLRYIERLRPRLGESEHYNAVLKGRSKEWPVARQKLDALRNALEMLYL